MLKIQKRCGFNGLVGIGQPAGNWPKMPKFTSEATAVHAPLRQIREAAARAGASGTQPARVGEPTMMNEEDPAMGR
ncbi:MAG: hypothetical protein GEV13_00035 [Rhodospirillales bacterium]|nr:hypothetical protein [Rhodospirillales bacterium]